jgi:type IV secretory pathway ATPase VirB11/archaellum biosynthesis ATPase
MAIYREVAINDMIGTVEQAMRQVMDCWADLPPNMQDAIDQFRAQLEAAIDSVEFVKRALGQEVHDGECRLS